MSHYQAGYENHLNPTHQGFSTKSIHDGQKPEPVHGSVNVPIHLTTTYAQKGPADLYSSFDYTRCGNPTRAAFEEAIASVEYANHCIAFSSGCAAMTSVLHLLQTGDHMICCDDVYGGTQRYMRNFTEKMYKIKLDFIDLTDLGKVEKSINENTKLIWVETPTNPLLKVIDIKQICLLAKQKNILTLVDNTFASPYLQSPLLLGADISLNSVTKYINGHSDVVMGTLTTNSKELNDRLFFSAKSIGGCPSPFDCYMAMRGLKTLEVRMRKHCENGIKISQYLQTHPKCEKVIYVGLESHPQHQIVKQQMRGYGGMISFYVKGGLDQARVFLQSVKVFTLAESLGGVESLIESPALMTHASVPKEVREQLGIADNLIRISVGIEDDQDLIKDLEGAFQKI